MSMLQYDERIAKACGELNLDVNTVYKEFEDVYNKSREQKKEFPNASRMFNDCLTNPYKELKRRRLYHDNAYDILAAYNLCNGLRVLLHIHPDMFKEQMIYDGDENERYDANETLNSLCLNATCNHNYEVLVLLLQRKNVFKKYENDLLAFTPLTLELDQAPEEAKKFVKLFLDYGADIHNTRLRETSCVRTIQRYCEYESSRKSCREACWALLSVRKRGGTLQGANGRDAMSLVAKYLWVHRFKKIWYAKKLMKKIKV